MLLHYRVTYWCIKNCKTVRTVESFNGQWGSLWQVVSHDAIAAWSSTVLVTTKPHSRLASCVSLHTHTHARTHTHTHTSRVSRICSQVLVNILGISPEEEKDGYNVMSMWSLRWHFTNRSVTGAPYSIKGYSYSPSHSWTLWWRVQWLLGKIRRKGSF